MLARTLDLSGNSGREKIIRRIGYSMGCHKRGVFSVGEGDCRPNVQVRFRVGEYSASHDGAMVPRGILNLMET
jgi:hypothetical protein